MDGVIDVMATAGETIATAATMTVEASTSVLETTASAVESAASTPLMDVTGPDVADTITTAAITDGPVETFNNLALIDLCEIGHRL